MPSNPAPTTKPAPPTSSAETALPPPTDLLHLEPTTNPRGIPVFPFLPHVSDYVKSHTEVEGTLQRFQEMISKYTFMRDNVERRAQGLREKLPEMRRSLDVVRLLIARKKVARRKEKKNGGLADNGVQTEKTDGLAVELDDTSLDDQEHDGENGLEDDEDNGNEDDGLLHTTFPLQDTLYSHAVIDTTTLDSVYLWLGANVMVAYPLPEAQSMLAEKLTKAKSTLKGCEEDLEFIRVQMTTLEVAVARVHNWDVGEKRRLRERGELVDGEAEKK